MDYAVTTTPLYEPVSLARAKRHLHVDTDDEDDLIRAYLAAARSWCEQYACRAFLWQTVVGRLDDFEDEMIVPLDPLVAVASITYVDESDTTQTLSTSIYTADTTSSPGRILLAPDQTWPTCRAEHHDVTITYYAGHAATFTRSGNTLVVNGHLYRVNDPVQVYNLGGDVADDVPSGLTVGTQYYVQAVAGHTIALATGEGGEAVALADDGTGTHYIDALPTHYVSAILLRLTDLWTNRGDEDYPVSRGIRELLDIGRRVTL